MGLRNTIVSKSGSGNRAVVLFWGTNHLLAHCAPLSVLRCSRLENDLNLVQPTSRGRREVKLDATFELGEPVLVPFMGRIVIQNDVDFFVLRLIGHDPVEKAEKVFPFCSR